MRASGYMVQWEEAKRTGKWEKMRVYYRSKDDASGGMRNLQDLKARVRNIESHPLYKRA